MITSNRPIKRRVIDGFTSNLSAKTNQAPDAIACVPTHWLCCEPYPFHLINNCLDIPNVISNSDSSILSTCSTQTTFRINRTINRTIHTYRSPGIYYPHPQHHLDFE